MSKSDVPHWARRRRIALRPDGASRTFDPSALRVIRTEAERAEFAAANADFYRQAHERAAAGLPPAWLTALTMSRLREESQ